MAFPVPFRCLDRSGRSLVWVLLHEGKKFHTDRAHYASPACKIELCPRPNGKGQPQDITSRPCHSEGGDGFFRLKDEVHDWLENANTYYQLDFRYNDDAVLGWHVGFAEKDHAMLFKLAWGAV
jgi:hypothetical protein